MYIILRWVVNALALLLVATIVPGFSLLGFYPALIAALLLGFVNAVIRPVLLILTLPINILTLGLFTFVVNALMLWFVATIVKGFDIATFGTAILAAIILWLIGMVTNAFLDDKKLS
jgi:putative membrane protein